MSAPAAPPELAGFAVSVTGQLQRLADALPGPLRSPVRSLAARPGKGLRSSLLAACARFGRADPARLVRLGAVVELLHLASLLHDDVVDQAPVRRGQPAAHTVVGPGQAMLAGLACFALAGMEAASLGSGLATLVATTAAGLAYGEMLDVERAYDTALSLPDYLELTERKTGDLFRLGCLLGAAEAGAPPGVAGALAAFGTGFGVAYQVLDDCLDLAASATGKPAGTDHLLGLFGAPTLYALGADTTGELAALLLSPGFGPPDLPAVRDLVAASGGLAAAAGLARQRYDQALAALDGLDEGPRALLVAVTRAAWRDPA